MFNWLFRQKSFDIVLVFLGRDRERALPAILHEIVSGPCCPFASSKEAHLKLVHSENRLEHELPSDPEQLSMLLSNHHILMKSDAPEDGYIEQYSHAEFDFVVVRLRRRWTPEQEIAVPIRWHEALDRVGLRLILAGHELHVTAEDVRDLNPDAPFGYAISGLTFSSPSTSVLSLSSTTR